MKATLIIKSFLRKKEFVLTEEEFKLKSSNLLTGILEDSFFLHEINPQYEYKNNRFLNFAIGVLITFGYLLILLNFSLYSSRPLFNMMIIFFSSIFLILIFISIRKNVGKKLIIRTKRQNQDIIIYVPKKSKLKIENFLDKVFNQIQENHRKKYGFKDVKVN